VNTFFLVCAGLGGIVLVAQVALGAFGLFEAHAVDAPLEEGLELLSIRSVAAGLAFLGVGGLAGLWLGLPALLALLLGLGSGAAALVATARISRAILQFESDRTPLIEEAIGERGTVYLAIPGKNAGVGKVHVNLRGRLVELTASSQDEPIPTGAAITVVDTVGETLVVVPSPLPE
jgi:membrane protein implicated in regulation of membrane protease activity